MADRPRLLSLAGRIQAVIDEADWPLVKDLTLYRGTNGYVYFCARMHGAKCAGTLHAFLMNAPKGTQVDHINGDKLDNRRSNLRIVTHQLNQVNRKRLNRNNNSGLRGVAYAPRYSLKKPWRAQITVNRKNLNLGFFASKEEAIAARRYAELAHYGEMCP